MNADLQREETLFHAASALGSPTERALFLSAACAGDEALRKRIESMLSAETAATEFFHENAADVRRNIESTTRELAPEERPGGRIERYRLIEKIGEGGCGIVYLAEQQEPVRRQVALKVIKLGMDTRQVVGRFQGEQQALAMMDHPNIAKVFDAGATESGRPYFVMELVRGTRITDYCDEHKLSTAQRLNLFIQVCHAVQHAHQKGIIHRDLKPSNILATMHDGVPVPKVIDFGIAKATENRRADFTIYNELNQLLGTPAYMSPEQAEMRGMDVDTRSDIYSLGVLLYELLTGQLPFDSKRLLAAGVDEIRRTIREVEPPRPSTRLQTLAHGDLTAIAGSRGSDAPQLIGLVRGDLDWIVMKCLEKDRTRRYETSNGLARDIQRHLNDEAVTARPPTFHYKVQKLVRRNKLAFAAAVGVTLALLVATFVSLRQAAVARTARKVAERSIYIANMNLARRAWEENDIYQLQGLLDESANSPNRGFEWYYWQRQAHLHLKQFQAYRNTVGTVCISPDGDQILTAGDDAAKLWNLSTGELARTFDGHRGTVASAAFSPDGGRVVTASEDGTAIIWDAHSAKPLHILSDHSADVCFAEFSRNGDRVVTASRDKTVKIWDADTGTCALTLTGHGGAVRCARFSPDGDQLVTGSDDQTAIIWDARTGSALRTLRGHQGPVWSVAFSPDATRILTGSFDGTARLWDAETGTLAHRFFNGDGPYVWGVDFSPDGQLLAAGTFDRIAQIWNANTYEEIFSLKHGILVKSVAFSPNGKQIVTLGVDGLVKVWSNSTNQYFIRSRNHQTFLRALAFSSDSQRVISASADHTAKIWNRAGEELVTLQGHGDEVWCAAFSPDSKRVVTGSQDLTARVWDEATGKELLKLTGHVDRVTCAAFSRRDPIWLATGSDDRTVRLWDANTGKLLHVLTCAGVIRAVTFSVDNKWVIACDANSRIKIWNRQSGKVVHEFGSGNNARSAAFSPDGRWLVTGGEDGVATLLESATGRTSTSFTANIDSLISVSVSPDAERIVTVGEYDTAAAFWERRTGKQVLLIPGQGGVAALSPDGYGLAFGGGNAVWELFRSATEEQVAKWGNSGGVFGQHLNQQRHAAQLAVQHLPTQVGAISNWLVLAPITIPYPKPELEPEFRQDDAVVAAFDKEQLPSERSLRPVEGGRVQLGPTERVWRKVEFADGLIDLNRFLGEDTSWTIAYLVCYVESEHPVSGIALHIGSAERTRLYFNRSEVYKHEEARSWVPDQDVIRGLALNHGENVLVFKLVNGQSSHPLYSVRITDSAGGAIDGLKITTR